MLIYELILSFIIGACIGSFLNVCIYRIPKNESIVLSTSKCGVCGHRLDFKNMIPVLSYILNKGKCAYCGSKYSIRYMWVELITASIFAYVLVQSSAVTNFVLDILLMCLFIVIIFIDIDHLIIPNRLVLAVVVVGVINVWVGNTTVTESVCGVLTGLGIMGFIYLIGVTFYKRIDVLGLGDVKLTFALGILLSARGIVIMMYVAVIVCGILGIYLMIKGQAKNKKIPFGPFIILGAFTAYYYGDQIISAWLGRF